MHPKVFLKLKNTLKTLKTLSSRQKNPKNPKKPKKPKKPTGLVFFFKKPGFFPTLFLVACLCMLEVTCGRFL
jgi:hypothetical protein